MAVGDSSPMTESVTPETAEVFRRLGTELAVSGHLTVEAAELEPVLDGEPDRCARLLRLHHFARALGAEFHRTPDGRFTFTSLSEVPRPPHFQYVSTRLQLLPQPAPAKDCPKATSAGPG